MGVARAIALAILLAVIAPSFLVFALPPQISADNLPACCRRDGKHHCAMMMAAEPAASGHQFASLPEKCPFRDSLMTASRTTVFVAAIAPAHYAGLVSHPAHHEQVLAVARASEMRSHQKRGPPVYLSS